eukprot:355903-Chlamydomonas_euryale.AAC.15
MTAARRVAGWLHAVLTVFLPAAMAQRPRSGPGSGCEEGGCDRRRARPLGATPPSFSPAPDSRAARPRDDTRPSLRGMNSFRVVRGRAA